MNNEVTVGEKLYQKYKEQFESSVPFAGWNESVAEMLKSLNDEVLGGKGRVDDCSDSECPSWCFYPDGHKNLPRGKCTATNPRYYSIGSRGMMECERVIDILEQDYEYAFSIREYKVHVDEGQTVADVFNYSKYKFDIDKYTDIFSLAGDVAPTLDAMYTKLREKFETLK